MHVIGASTSLAQVNAGKVETETAEKGDTASLQAMLPIIDSTNSKVTPVIKSRLWKVGLGHATVYTGTLLALNQAWYAAYPRSNFHFFNDNAEWLQVDKVGHAWSAYHEGRVSLAAWKWAGANRKQQVLLGGLGGMVFQTAIETLDAFSSEWGWSWGDMAGNCIGTGMLIGQELVWGEQRIAFKWGFQQKRYADPMLKARAEELYGTALLERALKDYNGQSYWLSVNLKSFLPRSRLPQWFNIAVGYGAEGMFGARRNQWTDKDNPMVEHNRSDIKRLRQFYLAPDIDFTRIHTNRKWLKALFFVLNAFKMPSPALVLSDGKLGMASFYF